MSVINKWISVVLILTVEMSVWAQDTEFNKAVLAINRDDFVEAIGLLEQLSDNNVESKELFYNLGYAYLKNGQIGKSILSLERGRRLSPADENIVRLLSIANSNVRMKITKIPDFIVWQWYQRTALLLSSNQWAFLQIIIITIALIIAFLLMWGRLSGFRYKILLSGLVLLALLSYSLSYYQQSLALDSNAAIYMEEEGFIYSGADDRSDVVAELSEGVKMYLIDTIGEWYKVQLEDKDIGWVKKEKVEII